MQEEQVIVHLRDKLVILTIKDWEVNLDVDTLTSIDYSNLFGEIVTVPTLLNRIGILRAELETQMEESELELKSYEADLRKQIRRESALNEGKINLGTEKIQKFAKFTENALDDVINSDPAIKIKKSNAIKRKRDFKIVDNLFWSIKAKSDKLDNLLQPVTPGDFEKELLEGTVNGILIKKKDKLFK